MRSVRARLARLEIRSRGCSGGRCGACGWRGGDAVTYTCSAPRLIGEGPDPDDDPAMDTCPSCRRRLVFRIGSPRAIGAGPTAGGW